MDEYLSLLKRVPLSLDAGDGAKIPYGLRYHVLDVWIDGFEGCAGVDVDRVMEPVVKLSKVARSKVLRNRVKDALSDERLSRLKERRETPGGEASEAEDPEFAGFD